MRTPRPTDAEFEELKRQSAEATREVVAEIAHMWGVDPSKLQVHDCSAGKCYCACPDGPCQHIWDGPEYREENISSVTCSLCGEPEIYHDMRCGP